MSSCFVSPTRWLVGALVIASGWASGCSEVTLASEPSVSPSVENADPATTVVCVDHGDYRTCQKVVSQAHIEEVRRQHEQDRRMMQAQHEEQIDATMRAVGLDPDTGKGWWCFSGVLEGQALGECRRTRDACIERFMVRDRTGMQFDERRCAHHAQAACFRVTRTLKEGERKMCFDELATCERLRSGVDAEGFVSPPSECGVSD